MSAQSFFDDLKDDSSDAAGWFRGIKTNIERDIMQTKMDLGDSLDDSATQIFAEQVRDMSAAFARANTQEAAERKLAVKTLWRTAGRASEPKLLGYKTMQWHGLFKTPLCQAPQSKPSKLKYAVFLAGRERHDDWLLDWGDHIVFESRFSESRKNMSFDEGDSMMILDVLQGANAGTKLSG